MLFFSREDGLASDIKFAGNSTHPGSKESGLSPEIIVGTLQRARKGAPARYELCKNSFRQGNISFHDTSYNHCQPLRVCSYIFINSAYTEAVYWRKLSVCLIPMGITICRMTDGRRNLHCKIHHNRRTRGIYRALEFLF